MHLLAYIVVSIISCIIQAQTDTHGTCTIWGDPHLVGFPVSLQQAGLRSSYWCQYNGRMLIIKNAFLEFYVDVTDHPYWIENFEINLLYNETTLCTVTPDSNNCSSELLEVHTTRSNMNSKQIYYEAADSMEISVYSQWINGRLVYNIEVTQSYSLILNSSGLCVTRLSQCEIETSPSGRRKRSINEETVVDACEVFITEAKKTAQALGGATNSPMIPAAYEACITDVLLTNDTAWGESAAWFVLADSIRRASLSSAQREEIMMQIPSAVEDIVSRAKPQADSILGISITTTTIVSSEGTDSTTKTSTRSTTKRSTTTSSSNTNTFNISFILLVLVPSVVYSTFY